MVAPSKARPVDDRGIWPSLPLAEWQETHDTLHMWMQMVGKTRLALAPKQNHWWHVALYLTSRGLTTMPMPHGARLRIARVPRASSLRVSEGLGVAIIR